MKTIYLPLTLFSLRAHSRKYHQLSVVLLPKSYSNPTLVATLLLLNLQIFLNHNQRWSLGLVLQGLIISSPANFYWLHFWSDLVSRSGDGIFPSVGWGKMLVLSQTTHTAQQYILYHSTPSVWWNPAFGISPWSFAFNCIPWGVCVTHLCEWQKICASLYYIFLFWLALFIQANSCLLIRAIIF